jgi:hypothetical protein
MSSPPPYKTDFDLPETIIIVSPYEYYTSYTIGYRPKMMYINVPPKQKITEKFINGFIRACKRDQRTYNGYYIKLAPLYGREIFEEK